MSFWKPNQGVDRGDQESFKDLYNGRNKHLPLLYQRQLLPVYRLKREILYCIETYQTVILVGETGSGKSTQIPQFLYEAGWTSNGRCIVCTQPRRVATISVANRTAEEFGCEIGEEVGYAIRFDAKCSSKTVIKYCTDGLLLRETLTDPFLEKYSVVIVDEVHERSLYTDVLLGLLKKIKRKRPELRLIITSATVNALEMKEFFEIRLPKSQSTSLLTSTSSSSSSSSTTTTTTTTTLPINRKDVEYEDTACILSVTGRLHDVDILYLNEPTHSYLISAVNTVLEIHRDEDIGDILVFLPGSEDIDNAIHMLEERYDKSDLFALPLYSTLPHKFQMRVFDPTPPQHRKVVFATNIAETSITIEGIKYVVDAGFAKLKFFDPNTGIDALITCPASKSSLCQRAGRAGRTQVGKCFRLMTESAFLSLPDNTPPEMQRTDISWAVLQLKALGVHDVLHFDFFSPPSVALMMYGLELLYSLGALDDYGNITTIGIEMADMPVEPRLSKCIISSINMKCSEEILSIAAMCSVDYPFITIRSRNKEAKERLVECSTELSVPISDHLTLLNIYNQYQISGYNSSWCDSMCLQSRIMSRAREVRDRLKGMLQKYISNQNKDDNNNNNSSNSNNNNTLLSIESCGDNLDIVRKCLVCGYFANAAQLGAGGKYWTVRGRIPVSIHSTSVLSRFGIPSEWVIFHEVTHGDTSTDMREVTRIEPRWLIEYANHYYDTSKIRK